MNRNAGDKQPTMSEVIRSAVEGAASYRSLQAAKTKLQELASQKSRLELRVKDLNSKRAATLAEAISKQAETMLHHRNYGNSIQEELVRAAGDLRIIDETIPTQTTEIEQLRQTLTREVCQTLQSERQKLVDRIMPALATLRQVSIEDDEFLAELGALGDIDMELVPAIAFFPVTIGGDKTWASARKHEGFSV